MKTIKEPSGAPNDTTAAWATDRLMGAKKRLGESVLLLFLALMCLFGANSAHAESTASPYSSGHVEIKVSVRPHYRLQVDKMSPSAAVKSVSNSDAFCVATNLLAFALPVRVVKVKHGATTEITANDVRICGQGKINTASDPISLADAQPHQSVLVRPD
jgi:hypothetical protein